MSAKALTKAGSPFPNLFSDFFKPWSEWFDSDGFFNGRTMNVPAVNIAENKNDYTVSLAAPGMKKEDFKIEVDGSMLTISSEKEESAAENEARYTRKEYSYSSFSRSFTLPEHVNKDSITAGYNDGVLSLTLPKKEEVKKISGSRQIAVK